MNWILNFPLRGALPCPLVVLVTGPTKRTPTTETDSHSSLRGIIAGIWRDWMAFHNVPSFNLSIYGYTSELLSIVNWANCVAGPGALMVVQCIVKRKRRQQWLCCHRGFFWPSPKEEWSNLIYCGKVLGNLNRKGWIWFLATDMNRGEEAWVNKKVMEILKRFHLFMFEYALTNGHFSCSIKGKNQSIAASQNGKVWQSSCVENVNCFAIWSPAD